MAIRNKDLGLNYLKVNHGPTDVEKKGLIWTIYFTFKKLQFIAQVENVILWSQKLILSGTTLNFLKQKLIA